MKTKTIKLSEKIISEAKIASKISNRSVDEQIEHWVKIGKITEQNPDLTYEFIKDILAAQSATAEATKELEPYLFGNHTPKKPSDN